MDINLKTTQIVEITKKQPFVLQLNEAEFQPVDIVRNNIFLTQNFQEGLVLRNVDCETDVFVGAAVVMSPLGVAKLAIATSYENANVIGIIEAKTAINVCDIRFLGVTSDIFLNLNVGDEYYLSDKNPGEIVTTINAPTIAGRIRIKLGQPFSSTKFVFTKGERIIKG
jgi:hypothetical protein